ncbi:MAG: hypothetical protein ABFS86_03750, partial [Planctomycetota bacterium]
GSEPEAALDRAIQLADAARRLHLTEKNCPFSPAGVVMRIGSDPEALAGFVREHIGYEPYVGVVRGARGTLAAGAGGDWDRAVLLAALLAEAGYESRLVAVERTDTERAARVDAFLASRGRERALGAAGPNRPTRLPTPSPLLAEVGVSLPNLDLDLARGAARWRKLLDESQDAAAGLMPVLRKALDAGGAKIGRPLDEWKRALAGGAAERVLVLAAGHRLNPGPDPANAPAPDARAKTYEQPPVERVARLGVRLGMSVAGEGAPEDPVVLLDRTFEVGELFARPIRFQIAPDGSAGGREPPNEWSEEEWAERIAKFERFQAMLEVGRLWISSDAFDVYGRTFKVKGDGRIESAKGMGSSVGRGFGFGGGGKETPSTPKTRIGALTLELTLTLPGTEPIRARRLIWGDLRRDVSPVYLTDLVVFGGPVGPETLLWRTFDAATANIRFEARILSSDDRYRMVRTDDMRMLHQTLQDWQLARLGIAARLLEANDGLALLGGPALVMKSEFIVPDKTEKTIRRRTVIDVVHDGVLLVPRKAEAGPLAAEANMMLGAAKTILESCLVRERRPTARVAGAFAAFERAAIEGHAPAVARVPDIEAAGPPELARWAIEGSPPGRILVFPRAGDGSWFSIDPATGAAIGRGGGGEGQSLAEYKAAIKTALKNLKCMLSLAKGMGQGQSNARNSYEWMKCVTGFDPAKASSYTGAVASYQSTTMGFSMWSSITKAVSGCEKLVAKAKK